MQDRRHWPIRKSSGEGVKLLSKETSLLNASWSRYQIVYKKNVGGASLLLPVGGNHIIPRNSLLVNKFYHSGYMQILEIPQRINTGDCGEIICMHIFS